MTTLGKPPSNISVHRFRFISAVIYFLSETESALCIRGSQASVIRENTNDTRDSLVTY